MAFGVTQFDFGDNWQEFSVKALTPERVALARNEFLELVSPLDLHGRTFLDIGFGQGLSLLAAAAQGAKVIGCDINPKCAAVLEQNLVHFRELAALPVTVVGSILDPNVTKLLKEAGPPRGYDVVHSWGVLHHTGNMKLALEHSASLVSSDGFLIIAIYNRHWTSPVWNAIKWAYMASPRWLRPIWVKAFTPIIFAAKWIVTRKSPSRQQRGMAFHFNVVDWIGGYPYEYATADEVKNAVEALGFEQLKLIRTEVPTGCNQFVFIRSLSTP
jgi:2-polyprenyl-3-methyl-5-hydroxy-6-metoxy-1,4-benzoquinol methylase